jgi:hypothetical protein
MKVKEQFNLLDMAKVIPMSPTDANHRELRWQGDNKTELLCIPPEYLPSLSERVRRHWLVLSQWAAAPGVDFASPAYGRRLTTMVLAADPVWYTVLRLMKIHEREIRLSRGFPVDAQDGVLLRQLLVGGVNRERQTTPQ